MPDALRAPLSLLIPAGSAVVLMVLWAVLNGGYDTDTWYWGALLLLGVFGATAVLGLTRRGLSRASRLALVALAAYLAWSYLSMAWAKTPGWALEGSNRTLLYAVVFVLLLLLPWTRAGALVTLTGYALAIGVIALVLWFRLASHDHLASLVIDGRLAAPTGYFNSTVALFMTDALLATALASRRDLPGVIRGLLIGAASASLQLCVMGQSRGWLFTLPVVLLLAATVVRDRLRVAVAAALPAAAALIPVHRLLGVFQGHSGAALDRAATRAGREALLLCAATIVVATLLAWAESLRPPRPLSARARRRVGAVVAALAIALAGAGVLAATHGRPVAFVKRQWHGFIHPASATGTGSHFNAVGTGRYDFWRVGLDAVAAHPLGGLGQDNFSGYYVSRRRTYDEPRWTHSIEIRLLTHTGIVGALLFGVFLIAALAAALRGVRRGAPSVQGLAAAALLPLVVWLVHGSLDWFWEMPALSGPALGFLGLSIALGEPEADATAGPQWTRARDDGSGRIARWLPRGLAAAGLAAAVCVLGFPYLSARDVSAATDVQAGGPLDALAKLKTAAELNPLAPEPTRLGGLIALRTGRYLEAQRRFEQTIDREPDGWFGWLGAGLASSTLGDVTAAERDFQTAARINPREATVQAALEHVKTLHPLSPAEALKMLAND